MKTNPPKLLSNVLLLPIAGALCAYLLGTGGQASPHALPSVLMIGVPTYPPIARATHVEGVVHIRVTTDGQRVTAAEVQDGPKLLAIPAEDNVKTWQFSPHEPTTFIVTYRYKLEAQTRSDSALPSVVLRLPTDVDVSAMPRDTVDLAPDKSHN